MLPVLITIERKSSEDQRSIAKEDSWQSQVLQYFPSLTTRLICQHDSEYGWQIQHNELQLGKSELWHELPSEKTQDAMKVIWKFLRSISK